ncbi:MAG TPA: carboxylate--amine ligase [Pseudonocardiaceae bacterium]
MSIDTTTPAVVLTLDRNGMHHGGLGAIRSLGRLGVPVYGVHDEPLGPAASSRYLSGHWFWRAPADDAERLLTGLITLAERIGSPSVLIPTDDAGAIFLAEHGAELRQWFRFSDPPSDLPRRVADRYTLYQLCRELGVPCLAAARPGSLAEADEFAAEVGFPLIAMPGTPAGASRRSAGRRPQPRDPSMLHNRDELARAFHDSETAPGAGLMLQEFVPRCPSQDYFFYGYCDAGSRCEPGFVGLKERCYPALNGRTSLGRWVENPDLHAQATELLSRLGFQGIVALDYRWDPRDGQYKLLGFNPRLGEQFRLFQDDAGVDVVVAAHLDLTGRPISSGAQRTGRRLLVENRDPAAALGCRRNGELNLLWWVMSLRLVNEMAWYARDDLRPFGLMCLRTGWRAVTPITRGLARSRSGTGSSKPPRFRRGRAAPAAAPPPPAQAPQPQEPQPDQPLQLQPDVRRFVPRLRRPWQKVTTGTAHG